MKRKETLYFAILKKKNTKIAKNYKISTKSNRKIIKKVGVELLLRELKTYSVKCMPVNSF